MGFCYNKLWKLLIDNNMRKVDLQNAIGISSSTMAKLGRDENVNMDILAKICEYFKCDICDILHYEGGDTKK